MAKTKAWYMVCVLKLIETCLGQDPGVWGKLWHCLQFSGRDQWPMGRNYDKIFVTIDQGPGQVPLGDQGSGRGSAGECQLGVNGQFLSKTVTKSVNFCLKYAWKVFNFGYVELNKERKDKLLTICLKIRNKLSLFLYWIVIQWRFLTH